MYPIDCQKEIMDDSFGLTDEAVLEAPELWVAELPNPAGEPAVGTAGFAADAVAATCSTNTSYSKPNFA